MTTVEATTAAEMRLLGQRVAARLAAGDVLVLSGPLDVLDEDPHQG